MMVIKFVKYIYYLYFLAFTPQAFNIILHKEGLVLKGALTSSVLMVIMIIINS